MRKSVIIILIFILTLIGVIKALQEGWQSLEQNSQEGDEPTVSVINSTNNNVTIYIDLKGFWSEVIEVDSTTYQRLDLPDYLKTDSVGLPELPIMAKMIAIPECDSVIMSIELYDSITFDSVNVYPVPQIDTMVEFFAKDTQFYNTDTIYPFSEGEINEIGYIRSQKVCGFMIYPFKCNPLEQELIVFQRAYVTFDFVNPSSDINVNAGLLSNVCENVLLNYELGGIGAARVSDTSVSEGSVTRKTGATFDSISSWNCDYLIICGNELYNIIADTIFDTVGVDTVDTQLVTWDGTIARHRADFNGYDVIITKMEDIYDSYIDPYDTVFHEALWLFIKDVYEDASAEHTWDGHLGYVLLIGDACVDDTSDSCINGTSPGCWPDSLIVPASDKDEWFGGDYYYSCVAGDDNLGDIMIGRFSVGDTAELRHIVEKTIKYEPISYEPYDSSWTKKALFCAEFSDQGVKNTANDGFSLINSIINDSLWTISCILC